MPDVLKFTPHDAIETRHGEIALDDVKRYVAEHRQEPEFAATEQTPFWHLEDALFSFEAYCNRLRNEGSSDLYRARELTYFLDVETGSLKYGKSERPHEIAALLLTDIANRVAAVSHHDSREKLEAKIEHEQEIVDLNSYAQLGENPPHGLTESVLAIIEDRIVWIDHEIEREDHETNEHPADEQRHRANLKALADRRRPYRRARASLLKQYFNK